MSTTLITGASGFIGKALAQSMKEAGRDVVCISRSVPKGLDVPFVRGDFQAFEDLRALDDYDIDCAVHLAAVTGNGMEREQVLVNAEGSRCLMRYLVDRGCKKFVMASSIALVGMQNTAFRPLSVPVPDDHPCLDRDGYGFSKHLMEQVTHYMALQNPGIDVINLRLAAIVPDDSPAKLVEPKPIHQWALGSISIMVLSDAVRAFAMAAEAPHRAGVRTMNCTGPKAWVKVPTAEVLRNWWGDDVDLSHFEHPGHEWDAAYDVALIEKELGFVAEKLPGVVWPDEYGG